MRRRVIGNMMGQPSGGSGLFQGLRFTLSPTAANTSVSFPCKDDGVFDATINWGDGTGTASVTAYNDANLSHTYATAGDYTVEIVGDFPNIVFFGGGAGGILTNIEETEHTFYGSMEDAFRNCNQLTSFPGSFDLSGVTDTRDFFNDCSNLASVPAMYLPEVINADAMFSDCDSLDEYGGLIELPKCTRARYIFNAANFGANSVPPPLRFRDLTDAYYGFRNSGWVTFQPNVFDDCLYQIDFGNAFNNNGLANEQSVENILVSLSVCPGRTIANTIVMSFAPDVSVIQANTTIMAAVAELNSHGWTVNYNGTVL